MKIIIENIDPSDGSLEEALREVANKIEEGYTNGIIGYSNANWYIETEE